MRFATHTLLIAVTVAATVATWQPSFALGVPGSDQAPLNAEENEKRKARLKKDGRILSAERASLTRKMAAVRFAYVEKCEAAFVAGEPMPEKDVRTTGPVVIDEDLIEMTLEEISEQFGLASEAFKISRDAVNDCLRKYVKKRKGGS
ncbi:hypothetical protein [Sedimentitalea sp.]|uniref:hypothetical protein n=1 Tax=Sedimentitalea sp. TaxID=2048915 RepID=UPI003298567E